MKLGLLLFFSHLRVNETLSGMHGVHSRVPVWLWRAPHSQWVKVSLLQETLGWPEKKPCSPPLPGSLTNNCSRCHFPWSSSIQPHSDSLSGFTVEPLSFLRTVLVCLSSGIPVRQMTFFSGSLTHFCTHTLSSSLLLCHTLVLPALDFIPAHCAMEHSLSSKRRFLFCMTSLSSRLFYVCVWIWVAALPPAHTQVSFILS